MNETTKDSKAAVEKDEHVCGCKTEVYSRVTGY